MTEDRTDVVVIGSGFGGSAAALRFAEAGCDVLVLERGDSVSRQKFEADADALFKPERGRYGMNEFRSLGRHVVAWLGAAVGGGSHVYAATLKRRECFDDFPQPLRNADLGPYYERGEQMLDAQRYPDYPPYSEIRAVKLMHRAEAEVARLHPERVEDYGRINLGISFAPPDGTPGAHFTNKHGVRQQYEDPDEQKLLGGDIDTKNSLDRNYLHLAKGLGATVRPLCHVDRIEPTPGGEYRVHYQRFPPLLTSQPAWRRRLPWAARIECEQKTVVAKHVVVAAGSIGSSKLLLNCRDRHGTLENLSAALGSRYSSNGDYVVLMLPFRGFFVSWAGLAAVIAALIISSLWLAGAGAGLYFAGLLMSRGAVHPDIGTTNSDYIRFSHRDGSSQGAYIEGGRYPRPDRLLIAFLMSLFGCWKPERYERIRRFTDALARWLPPFELFARSWPIPLLMMGRDDARGRFHLDEKGELTLEYPLEENRDYYGDLERLGGWIASAADAWFVPNFLARITKVIEVPHNLGGVPMGETAADGVVDHAGRVFGYDNLLVLDGSIVPTALGPNPALTILALAERGLEVSIRQLKAEGVIRAGADSPQPI